MSCQEENGTVVLRIAQVDWANLMMCLGIAAGALPSESPMLAKVFNLVNRLNQVNPNYTPYQVKP